MKKNYTLLAMLLSGHLIAQHNYELYNNGALLYTSATSDIYVLGDMHQVAASDFQHSGFMEVQGNAYASNTMRQTGTGTVRMHNRTTNLGQVQTIYGANGFAVRGGYSLIGTANDGSFYNLELANDQGTVYLSGGGYVADVRNSVNFRPLGGVVNRIITADPPPTALPTNGALYPSIFGIMSRTASGGTTAGLGTTQPNNTVTTNGFSSAIDNGYVQGKVRQAINPAGGIYGFVVGLEPTAAGPTKRGLQYVHINFQANTYDVVTSYFQSGSSNVVAGSPNECSGYLINYFGGADHGEWVFNQIGGNTGNYEVKIWPQNDAFPAQTVWLITKDDQIQGTANDCGPSPVALDRAGFSGFSEFGAAGATILLATNLTHLRATPIENRFIRVDWTTAKEEGVSHFEIERSLDDMHFQYLTSHSATGYSSTAHTYFIDDNAVLPNQNYYYRIKVVNLDGSIQRTHSVVASLDATSAGIEHVNVFPNPVHGTDVNVAITSVKDRDLHIRVYDVLGRVLYTKEVVIQQGLNQLSIPSRDWAAAVYYIQIVGDDFSSIKEFVKRND